MTILVVVAILAAAAAWWGARRAGDATEYFAAGHRAGAVIVGIAGTAAAVSAFTFVGGPALFAAVGAGSLWIILSAPLTGALQCWAVGESIAAVSAQRPVLTVPELLGRALASRAVTAATAVVVLVGVVASLAVQARAAAVLGEVFLGVSPVLAAVTAMAATAAYTASGGMRTGLLADAIQGGVMAGAAVVIAVAAVIVAGGPAAVIGTLAHTRPDLLGSLGGVGAGRAASWYLLFCLGTLAQPHYLQKFLFLRSPAELRRLPAVLTGALAATLAVWLGVGLAGTALIARGNLAVTQPDDLAPRVVALLGPWAVVLAGVAVLAALMSTAASFMNLAAAAVTRDLPAAWGRAPLPLGWARATTVLVGAAATVVGISSERGVALLGIAGWGFFTAALLPAVVLGLSWRGARAHALVAAIIVGAVADLAIELGKAALAPAVEPGLAGAALGTLVLIAGSLAANRRRTRRFLPKMAPHHRKLRRICVRQSREQHNQIHSRSALDRDSGGAASNDCEEQ